MSIQGLFNKQVVTCVAYYFPKRLPMDPKSLKWLETPFGIPSVAPFGDPFVVQWIWDEEWSDGSVAYRWIRA